ncbi:hypothetical protein C2G38_280009 [Gigaspora rosea]|uniref:U6 snRNA phosphodiesterase 1 n=1 Tax=Gigaspora rosea TaxID=44941 RepID=A0A397UG79_9GLOM|nr:hypothetical protein C2G38_280009 [Gigaspora rosea]
MKGLVDYTSSDSDNEELDYDINQSKKHKETPYSEKNNEKRKAEETDKPVETNKKRGSVLTPTVTTKKLPPLPLEFLELYQDERRKNYTKHIEDPSSHQGRVRTKPHVEGNWATHVYMEVVIPEDFKSLLRKMKICAQNAANDDIEIISYINNNHDYDDYDDNDDYNDNYNNDDAKETNFRFPNTQEISGDSKLHISLSRPLFLKYFQIERFWDNLRKGFEDKKRFSLSFSEISNFTNDEKTRSFLALEVGKGINELKTLLEHVNKVAKDFRQEEFYEVRREVIH